MRTATTSLFGSIPILGESWAKLIPVLVSRQHQQEFEPGLYAEALKPELGSWIWTQPARRIRWSHEPDESRGPPASPTFLRPWHAITRSPPACCLDRADDRHP